MRLGMVHSWMAACSAANTFRVLETLKGLEARALREIQKD